MILSVLFEAGEMYLKPDIEPDLSIRPDFGPSAIFLRFGHSSNIPCMLVTFVVSKDEMSSSVREEHDFNIQYMSLTFSVLNIERSRDLRLWHLLNMLVILDTFFVLNRPEKSIERRAAQLSNIYLMLETFLVSNIERLRVVSEEQL